MSSIYQKTLSKEVSFRGIGLHSGKNSSIKIIPAKENSGIVFKRVDLIKNNIIKANYSNVSSARLCTTLENNFGIKVSTVEHLLAALYISDIDNVIIEVDSEEVPIMDGSAKNFLEVLNAVKLETQNKKRKFLKISEKIELLDGKRKISIEPNDNLEVDFQLDYENSLIGNQRNIVNLGKDNLNDISISRTFCLYEDIEKIKKNGLAKGGSLDNAVVVENDKILNKGGLRNKKEFVNHKILDLVGDFLLSGYRIVGKVKCYQGGHELTNMFLRKLLESKSKLNRNIPNSLKISNKLTNEPITKLAANA